MKRKMQINDEHLLDINEVAQLLNFSRSFVYKLIREKKLRAIRFGAHLRVRREEVYRCIREEEEAMAQGNLMETKARKTRTEG